MQKRGASVYQGSKFVQKRGDSENAGNNIIQIGVKDKRAVAGSELILLTITRLKHFNLL